MSDPKALRSLPPVNEVLDQTELADLNALLGRSEVVRSVRVALDEARAAILSGSVGAYDAAALAARARELSEDDAYRLRSAINATGILLNTGLGRAPLAPEAAAAVGRIATGYCSLEIDLSSGDRGSRTSGVEPALRRLTGAEAATVVNNNAAATVLTLRALAAGREVIVSRGQLVEIGGSFRLPEIFEASGAKLREVGTTNRTRLVDYERAIGPDTAALLRVHPSNYRILGFVESVGIAELAKLAQSRGLWAIDDVGSGMLRKGMPAGVLDEPSMAEGIEAGADVVLASGDKLLGGPQCGLIVGRSAAIDRLKSDPLMRAFRVDKMTLAALDVTLRLAARGGSPSIPLWELLATPVDSLHDRARVISERLNLVGFKAEVEETEAMLGGGSTPTRSIPSRAVRLAPPYPDPFVGLNEASLAQRLRQASPPIVTRIHGGAVLLDLRAVFPAEDAAIITALTPSSD
jgi:L-seryl-tRNA(Ser) seleniumtransferase